MKKIVPIIGLVILLVESTVVSAAANDGKNVKAKAASCVGCHGDDGNSIAPTFPRLAGQHVGYLSKQLLHFKNKTRSDAMMQGMATALSDGDIKQLANYYASQKAKYSAKDDELYVDEDEEIQVTKTLIAEGKKIYLGGNSESGVAACTACHGPTGKGNPSAGFPVIAGQYPLYIAKSLQAYKSGERSDPSSMMALIAKKISQREINSVSAYISNLR